MRLAVSLVLLFVCAPAPALHAQPPADLDPIAPLDRPEARSISQLATQARLLHDRLTQLRTLKRDAIKDTQARLIEASLVAATLSKPPMNDKQIDRLREQIKSRPTNAARYEAQLKAGLEKDPDRRAAMKKQAEQDKAAATLEMQRISLPYDTSTEEVRERARALNNTVHARLQPLFRIEHSGPLAAESFRLTVRLESGYVGASWRSQNRTIASASLRLDTNHPDPAQADRTLDGRFPMTIYSERSMQVHAGDFAVRMHLTNQADQPQPVSVQDAVKRLIDLEALEKIDAEAGQPEMS